MYKARLNIKQRLQLKKIINSAMGLIAANEALPDDCHELKALFEDSGLKDFVVLIANNSEKILTTKSNLIPKRSTK